MEGYVKAIRVGTAVQSEARVKDTAHGNLRAAGQSGNLERWLKTKTCRGHLQLYLYRFTFTREPHIGKLSPQPTK